MGKMEPARPAQAQGIRSGRSIAVAGVAIAVSIIIAAFILRSRPSGQSTAAQASIESLRARARANRDESTSTEARAAASKFDALYRAVKAIRAETAIGVSYVRFGQLVSNLATEYTIVGDNLASHTERQLHSLYGTAIAEYNLSLAIWKMRFDQANQFGMIPVSDSENPNLRALCENYSLTVADAAWNSGSKPFQASKGMTWPARAWFFPDSAPPLIWPFAGAKIDKANEVVIALQRGIAERKDL
jgi:hypothetical protein